MHICEVLGKCKIVQCRTETDAVGQGLVDSRVDGALEINSTLEVQDRCRVNSRICSRYLTKATQVVYRLGLEFLDWRELVAGP